MPKKMSHGSRASSAARRPTSTSAKVALVRTSPDEVSGGAATATLAPTLSDAPRASVKNTITSKSAATKAATPKAGPVASTVAPPRPAAGPTSAAQRARVQRAMKASGQTTTRRSLIRAENYAYVRHDLVLIGVVAVLMFAAMIVLHFVLPS